MHIQGKKIFLRSILPSDADLIYKWENDKSNWKVSNTKTPFTKKQIHDFISNHHDIYTAQQLRLMICLPSSQFSGSKTDNPIGCIDLFNFDPYHRRVGIGVLIAHKKHRNNGYASEALSLLIAHCFDKMHLQQLYCNITQNNKASLKLFQKHKFKITGRKKEWILDKSNFMDEYILQLINR